MMTFIMDDDESPTIAAHGYQGSNDDESPSIAVNDTQDFEPNMEDYEADTFEEVAENSDDDHHPRTEQVTDNNIDG